jgi:hypothetical protein
MGTTKGNCAVIHNENFTMLHFLKTFPISMEMYNHFSKVLLMMSKYLNMQTFLLNQVKDFEYFRNPSGSSDDCFIAG